MFEDTPSALPPKFREVPMEGKSKSIMLAFAFLCPLFLAAPATAQRTVFDGLRIRFNTNDRKQVESSASLKFDDTSRRILVESGQKPVQINYDDVAQVIFDWRLLRI